MTQELDVLILGAGWTGTFLIPLLRQHKLFFAATTSDGRKVSGSPTIKFLFDPADTSPGAFGALPRARHVLIVFPLKGPAQSRTLVHNYGAAHGTSASTRFIQLGSTGIWKHDPAQTPWVDRASAHNRDNPRAVAEDELLALGGCVLNLAGLWGGNRDPRHWVARVATTKEAVGEKTSLHMVHGVDVARVIVALLGKPHGSKSHGTHAEWDAVGKGQRWMVTDGFVYDWWSLFAGWAATSEGEDHVKKEPTKQAGWVYELMREEGVRALPRSMEALGRCYDTRELWSTLGIAPLKGGLGL